MTTLARHASVKILGACLMMLMGGLMLSAQDSGYGCLKVKAKPSIAGVFIDGAYVGPAAASGSTIRYSVPAGEHEVTLKDPRYQDLTTKVTIEAGKATTLSQSLQPAAIPPPPFGELRTVGGKCKFDPVYVNDRYVGHIGERLLLNPGEYSVKVFSLDGSQEVDQKVTIAAKKSIDVQVPAK